MEYVLPPGLKLSPGSSLTFVNEDSMPHTVTAEKVDGNGQPLFDLLLEPGARGTLTFTDAHLGTQPFFCVFHPGMVGTLEISPALQATAAPQLSVEISGMKFPAPFEVKSGTTVEFVNKDRMPHTVTSDRKDEAGKPLFRLNLPAGGKGTLTFGEDHLGVQPYFCEFHRGMRGELTVSAAATAPGSGDGFENAPALPDLAIHVPSILELGTKGTHVANVDGKPHLKYTYSVANPGPGHLVLVGDGEGPRPGTLKARQLAYQGKDLVQVKEAGQFHPEVAIGRSVWHYDSTGKLKLTRDDLPGWSAEVAKSHFAMVNSGPALNSQPRAPGIPETVPGEVTFEDKRYKLGLVPASEPRAGQRLMAGTFDRYGPTLNKPLPLPPGKVDGVYTLTASVDEADRVAETNEDNNVEQFRVTVQGGQVSQVEHL